MIVTLSRGSRRYSYMSERKRISVNLTALLKDINVLCRDNGKVFTDIRRLAVIEEKLRGSEYISVSGDLFRLFSKKPVSEIKGELLLVSSHVDCEDSITECFSRDETSETLKGTYDNSITNAAVLALMMEGTLPENLVVAFTGDEEKNSGGAVEVTRYLKKYKKEFQAIVLDVTDFGWNEGADFTIENNFWKEATGRRVCSTAFSSGYPWLFVPEDANDIPAYIPESRVYPEEAEPDESWDYDEQGVKCFSLCLPVNGPMHSNEGVTARKRSYLHYVETLNRVCESLCLGRQE